MKSTVSTIIRQLRIAIVCTIGAIAFPSSVLSQWNITAPNLLGVQGNQMGSIYHKGGITWAASHQVVFMSADSGKTWKQKLSGGLEAGDYINDLNFFDDRTGIFCTNKGNAYYTNDQGVTWQQIHQSGGAASGAFLSDPSSIILATGAAKTVDVTRDGGITWTHVPLGGYVSCVKPLIGGSALALAGNDPMKIFKTTDFGVTWVATSGTVGYDSYSFDVIPCEPEHIVAINEAFTFPNKINNGCEIYLTNDGGNTWTITNSQPFTSKSRTYFCGSVSMTTRAIFVQTTQNGVLRSTDQGTSWQPIGGPSTEYDTRLVYAISPNIVLAADSNGSIWRTINSGGDSITNVKPYEGLSITPLELFATDTLTNCDSPVIESSVFKAQLCSFPKVDTEFVLGPDSLDYKIVKGIHDSLSALDSVVIAFKPRGSGTRSAQYVLVLVDGTHIIVPLRGSGRNVTFVEAVSQSISLDTIGGFANVPISIRGLPKKERIDLVLHYDPKLRYHGTFSLSGSRLDDQGSSWAGRSSVSIDTAHLRLDTISAFAIFQVYPDGDTCFRASVDSLSIRNPLAPCIYSLGPDVPVEICPPRGCAIMTITNFLLHHWYPHILTVPNPSTGSASVESDTDLGFCSVVISDALGREVSRFEKQIDQGSTLLRNDLPAGNYFIQIFSSSQTLVLPLVVSK